MESVRTCLVCRKKGEKPELCRFVRALDGEICFDEKGELPHRGAWLCPNRACLEKAFAKRVLFKGERTLPVDGQAMIASVFGRIKKSSLSRLGLLRKLGQIEVGREAVQRLVKDGRSELVILAKDLSQRSQDEVKEKVAGHALQIQMSPFLMDELGQSLGRKKTGVVGLSKSRITDEILLQLKKLSNLEGEPLKRSS